jgi:hypothetical protein
MKQRQAHRTCKTHWARLLHGLLRLEVRAWPKNTRARGPEWNGPSLNHGNPWIEGGTPAHGRKSTLTASTGARVAAGLGLGVTALVACLLGVLVASTFVGIGGRASIGAVVARSARVGGGGWSGVLLPGEQGMAGNGGGALGVEELLHKEVRASAKEGVWRLA